MAKGIRYPRDSDRVYGPPRGQIEDERRNRARSHLDGLEAALVVADGTDLAGIPFFKMTGSGNDFVFLDGRIERHRALETPEAVRRLCARRTCIGADGVVWLLPSDGPGQFRMRYRNS